MKCREFISKFSYEIIVVIFPLFLFFLNKNLLFFEDPHVALIDNWIYAGYFINLDKYLPLFGETYYGDRISWILPGYGLYHLFPPDIAHFVLHISFFIACLLALFILLKFAFDRNTALFTSLLFGAYPFFLFEISSNCPTGAVITYMVLAFASLVLALKKNDYKPFLFMSGLFFACMAYAQMFSLVFLPAFFITYLLFDKKRKIQKILFDLGIFLAGGIIISAFFTLCNYAITGSPFFFVTQITKSVFYVNTAVNPWYIPISVWIWNAVWLVVPVLIAITSLICLYLNKKYKIIDNPFFFIFQVNYLVMLAIFIILNIKPNPIGDLQVTYYACYLIPLVFLALGAQLALVLSKIKGTKFLILIGVELLLFLPPVQIQLSFIKSIMVSSGYVIPLLCLIFLILIISSLSFIKTKNYQKSLLPLVVMLLLCGSFFLLYVNYSNFTYYNTEMDRSSHLGSDTDAYLLIFDTAQEINKYIPENQIGIWFGQDTIKNQRVSGIFNNINAIYLWQYTMIGYDFPNTTSKDPNTGNPVFTSEIFNNYASRGDSKIVILTTKEDAFYLAQESLRKINFNAKLIETTRLQRGELYLYCIIIEISPVDPNINGILNGSMMTSNNTILFFSLKEDSFINALEKNTYGFFGRDTVIANNGNFWIYSPTSEKDHLATPFFVYRKNNTQEKYLAVILLQSYDGNRNRYANSRIVLQDDTGKFFTGNLFVSPSNQTDRLIANVIHLPESIDGVRVYITSKDGRPAVLPEGMELYLISIEKG